MERPGRWSSNPLDFRKRAVSCTDLLSSRDNGQRPRNLEGPSMRFEIIFGAEPMTGSILAAIFPSRHADFLRLLLENPKKATTLKQLQWSQPSRMLHKWWIGNCFDSS